MKRDKSILYSVVISVMAHAVFFALAAGIRIPGVYTMMDASKRFFNIKALEREIVEKKPLKRRGVTYVRTLKFKSPVYSKSLSALKERDEGGIDKSAAALDRDDMREPVALSREDALGGLVSGGKDPKLLKKRARRDTRKDIVELKDPASTEGPAALGTEEISSGFLEKMPGFTPQVTGGFLDSAKRGVASRFTDVYTPEVTRSGDFADLEEYLICELSAYEDPADGQKYYRVSIRSGKDASHLAYAPKEIAFLIDCSLSIQPKRLEEFKEGLEYCLNHLNPEDRFNIVAFREEIFWLNPTSVGPDRPNIQKALQFVDGLTAGEGTDAYNALRESIKVRGAMKPSYIVLFSDGRPTHGMTDSREIINEITRLNKKERPIFAFSGGSRVNRYFLDFISYKNRGWTEYARRTNLIGRHIAAMYRKIKDPILLNMRYLTSGLDEKEVFPKSLPDFFRNAEFVLYGTYTDETDFSLRLLGDMDGVTNEFIVVGSLEDAAGGDEEIARNWAFNKIYHLIGLLEDKRSDEKILDEIEFLSKKFNIKTPYSSELAR